jgi:hypothetical protein
MISITPGWRSTREHRKLLVAPETARTQPLSHFGPESNFGDARIFGINQVPALSKCTWFPSRIIGVVAMQTDGRCDSNEIVMQSPD